MPVLKRIALVFDSIRTKGKQVGNVTGSWENRAGIQDWGKLAGNWFPERVYLHLAGMLGKKQRTNVMWFVNR